LKPVVLRIIGVRLHKEIKIINEVSLELTISIQTQKSVVKRIYRNIPVWLKDGISENQKRVNDGKQYSYKQIET